MKTKSCTSERTHGHTYRQWILTILVNTTVFTYGLDVGWMSPMTKVLQSEQSPAGEPLSDTMLSWIASIICLSAVFSVPAYSYIADTYGRKATVVALAVPQVISWFLRLCYASGTSLIISRMFSGFTAGACYNIVPMYVKEISQDNIRGVLGSLMVLVQNSGVFVMYIMGVYLDYYTIVWVVMGIPVLSCALLCRAPESPAYLMKTGKIEEATATIAFLRGLDLDHKTVQNEITAMKNEDAYFRSLPNMSLKTIVSNPIWRREIIAASVVIGVQSMNGAFAIVTYASTILVSTGVKFDVSPEVLTISIPAVLILGSSTTMICAEKFGRKTLIITMFSITTTSMLCIAVSMLARHLGTSLPGWLPVLSMMVSVWAYAAGVSSLPFVVTAEMFNFQIRAKVLGAIVTLAWFISFLPIVGYAPLSNAVGLHTTFFIFAGINLFGAFFTIFFLPETRGKSVEQIEQDVAKRIGLEVKPTTYT